MLNSGQVLSKSLFMKLRVLRFGNCWRASTSMSPLSPMFSSFNPQIFPSCVHRTPTQLGWSPEHGDVDIFQVENTVLFSFCRESLNLSSNSGSVDPKQGTPYKRSMNMTGHHLVTIDLWKAFLTPRCRNFDVIQSKYRTEGREIKILKAVYELPGIMESKVEQVFCFSFA